MDLQSLPKPSPYTTTAGQAASLLPPDTVDEAFKSLGLDSFQKRQDIEENLLERSKDAQANFNIETYDERKDAVTGLVQWVLRRHDGTNTISDATKSAMLEARIELFEALLMGSD